MSEQAALDAFEVSYRHKVGTLHERLEQLELAIAEAELGRHMLYITNEDKPGFIGRLGTALGDGGVNIATFHLGRSAPGADALALVEVDQPLTDEMLRRLRRIPNVVQAEGLTFS